MQILSNYLDHIHNFLKHLDEQFLLLLQLSNLYFYIMNNLFHDMQNN